MGRFRLLMTLSETNSRPERCIGGRRAGKEAGEEKRILPRTSAPGRGVHSTLRVRSPAQRETVDLRNPTLKTGPIWPSPGQDRLQTSLVVRLWRTPRRSLVFASIKNGLEIDDAACPDVLVLRVRPRSGVSSLLFVD